MFDLQEYKKRHNALVEKAAEAIENGIGADDFIQNDEIACMFEETGDPLDYVFGEANRVIALKRFLGEERTRDEIIAAMRCISSGDGVEKNCFGEDCPYYHCGYDCEKYVMRDALTLIEQ